MKKTTIIVIALALAAFMFSIANAGMGGGCGNCAQDGASAPAEPFRKFQADTIDLRQEMMTKRFEMQRENLKGTPDDAKLAALRADIKLLQTKILAIRSQSGLPVDKFDGECAQMNCGPGMKGMGGCGNRGMGGCNSGPCGGQK